LSDEIKFCPIIKETCKQDVCMMWSEDKCAFIQFFFGRLDQIKNQVKQAEKYKKERSKKEIPEILKNSNPEELANIMFEKYVEANPVKILTRQTGVCTPMRPRLGFRAQYQYLDMPKRSMFNHPEIEIKIERATEIVNKRLCVEWDEKYRERFEEEKDKIDKISADVLAWSRNLQLKEIKEADLQVYLVENKLNFLKESVTNLLNLVNLGLKE